MKSDAGKPKGGQIEERTVQDRQLLASYADMAHDSQLESEALQWCEALIGDAIRERLPASRPGNKIGAGLPKQVGDAGSNL